MAAAGGRERGQGAAPAQRAAHVGHQGRGLEHGQRGEGVGQGARVQLLVHLGVHLGDLRVVRLLLLAAAEAGAGGLVRAVQDLLLVLAGVELEAARQVVPHQLGSLAQSANMYLLDIFLL